MDKEERFAQLMPLDCVPVHMRARVCVCVCVSVVECVVEARVQLAMSVGQLQRRPRRTAGQSTMRYTHNTLNWTLVSVADQVASVVAS